MYQREVCEFFRSHAKICMNILLWASVIQCEAVCRSVPLLVYLWRYFYFEPKSHSTDSKKCTVCSGTVRFERKFHTIDRRATNMTKPPFNSVLFSHQDLIQAFAGSS